MTPGEEGGLPRVSVGAPPEADARLDGIWVLVVIHPDGGEGIFGQVVGDFMLPFVFDGDHMKERFEQLLRDRGTLELARREGKHMEWRRFDTVSEVDVVVQGPKADG